MISSLATSDARLSQPPSRHAAAQATIAVIAASAVLALGAVGIAAGLPTDGQLRSATMWGRSGVGLCAVPYGIRGPMVGAGIMGGTWSTSGPNAAAREIEVTAQQVAFAPSPNGC